MAIKTDFVAGDPIETASQVNERNLAILKNGSWLNIGNTVSDATSFGLFGTTCSTDNKNILAYPLSATNITLKNNIDKIYQDRTITSDWADADSVISVAIIGDYIYALLEDNGTTPDTFRVYRYAKTDITAGGTLMTAAFLTQTDQQIRMASDGTDLFFTFDAGASANDYEICRATISGTTLTDAGTITCGSTGGYFDRIAVDSTYIYSVDTADYRVRSFLRSDGSAFYTSGKNGFTGTNIHNLGFEVMTNLSSSAQSLLMPLL